MGYKAGMYLKTAVGLGQRRYKAVVAGIKFKAVYWIFVYVYFSASICARDDV